MNSDLHHAIGLFLSVTIDVIQSIRLPVYCIEAEIYVFSRCMSNASGIQYSSDII